MPARSEALQLVRRCASSHAPAMVYSKLFVSLTYATSIDVMGAYLPRPSCALPGARAASAAAISAELARMRLRKRAISSLRSPGSKAASPVWGGGEAGGGDDAAGSGGRLHAEKLYAGRVDVFAILLEALASTAVAFMTPSRRPAASVPLGAHHQGSGGGEGGGRGGGEMGGGERRRANRRDRPSSVSATPPVVYIS